MEFCEAMGKLKDGAKVTREPWKDVVYFSLDGNDVKSFQPKLLPYNYNEDIMVSDGWVIEGREGKHKFCDIIPFLLHGGKAKLSEWMEAYIFLDRATKSLVCHSIDAFPFIPDFESFVADDWIEL